MNGHVGGRITETSPTLCTVDHLSRNTVRPRQKACRILDVSAPEQRTNLGAADLVAALGHVWYVAHLKAHLLPEPVQR